MLNKAKEWLKQDWEKSKLLMKSTTKWLAGGIIGGLVASLIIISIFFISIDGVSDRITYKYYERVAKSDKIVGLVAELCGTHEENISKVKCVTEFYDNHYNYAIHNDTIRLASQFIEEGGVCRDFAVNVCSTIEEMGIKCTYGFGSNHVFPIIQFADDDEYNYCIYDGLWWCQR